MTDMDEIRNLLDEYVSWHDEWCPQHDAKCNTVHRAKEDAARSALLQRVEALREERDNLVRSRIDRAACCAQVEEERDAALAAQKRAEEERDEARRIAARVGDELAALRAALADVLGELATIRENAKTFTAWRGQQDYCRVHPDGSDVEKSARALLAPAPPAALRTDPNTETP